MQHAAFSNLADIAAAYQKEREALVAKREFRARDQQRAIKEKKALNPKSRKPWVGSDFRDHPQQTSKQPLEGPRKLIMHGAFFSNEGPREP